MRMFFISILFPLLGTSQEIDKKLHFLAGSTISASTYISLGATNIKPLPRTIISIGTGLVAGVAKETYDYLSYGKWDHKDFFATALGSFTITIPMSFDIYFKHNKL